MKTDIGALRRAQKLGSSGGEEERRGGRLEGARMTLQMVMRSSSELNLNYGMEQTRSHSQHTACREPNKDRVEINREGQ